MRNLLFNPKLGVISIVILLLLQSGCAQLRLPAIDPSGNRIFLPGSTGTQLLTPRSATGRGCCLNPLRNSRAATNPVFQPQPFTPAAAPDPRLAQAQFPAEPAFQNPPTPPPCNGSDNRNHKKKNHLVPKVTGYKTPGQQGQIVMTPSRIVAPVGSEVVVLAGICGDDGFLVKNQPLEWMLSNNSVGELVEVGGQHHSKFNQLIPPTAKKFSGQYAWGRTGLKKVSLSRGTPTPADDIELAVGQTYVSVSSSSPGTSYVTAIAPKAEGWDKRRASTTIHWVDGQWAVPTPTRATAGTLHPLTTVVSRTDGSGVKGWETRYSIVGGAPAEFAPTGSQTASATTNTDGQATVQIRQPAGQFEPGTTQVRVDIVRPPIFGEPELVVESGITSVTWSAPALTIRAIGPRKSEFDEPFNYRVEVTNPGDQISRGVVVRTKNLDDGIEFISSNPKPTEYGRQFEWELGDIAPNSQPRIIDIQMKSKKRGNVGMCFEVASASDRLQTEACAETEIVLPCIGYRIDGPTTATVGDNVSFNLSVENQCDEPLEDIEIIVDYAPGLLRPGKSNPATFRNPILQVGENQALPQPLSFVVQAPGTQCFNIEIRAKGVQPQFDRRCIEVQPASGAGPSVLTPSLGDSPIELTLRGGEPTVVGGQTLVEAAITNRGNTPLEGVTFVNRTSASLSPESISGVYRDKSQMVGDELFVNAGRINPGETAIIKVLYNANGIDPNATSDISVSTPSGANASQSIRIPIGAAGSIRGGAGSDVPDFQPDNQNGGGIGIPADGAARQGDISVRVQSLSPNIRVGEPSRVQFTVTNNGETSLRNVAIRMLIPGSVALDGLESGPPNLGFVTNDNNRQFGIRTINELRGSNSPGAPGESLTWIVQVTGQTPGLATIEVQAKSDDTFGVSSGNDVINISQ